MTTKPEDLKRWLDRTKVNGKWFAKFSVIRQDMPEEERGKWMKEKPLEVKNIGSILAKYVVGEIKDIHCVSCYKTIDGMPPKIGGFILMSSDEITDEPPFLSMACQECADKFEDKALVDKAVATLTAGGPR